MSGAGVSSGGESDQRATVSSPSFRWLSLWRGLLDDQRRDVANVRDVGTSMCSSRPAEGIPEGKRRALLAGSGRRSRGAVRWWRRWHAEPHPP